VHRELETKLNLLPTYGDRYNRQSVAMPTHPQMAKVEHAVIWLRLH
jgi:hypothetical protein